MKAPKKGLMRGLTAVTATGLALMLELLSISDAWRAEVDKALGTSSSKIVSEASDKEDLYTYKSDYKNTSDLVKAHKDLGEAMSAEGSVLLKNNGTLPLTSGAKVTLLGMRSVYSAFGGSMGSGVNAEQNVSLETALKDSGFSVNPVTLDIYTQLGSIKTGTAKSFFGETPVFGYQPGGTSPSFTPGNVTNKYTLGEPSTDLYSQYNKDYEKSLKEYNDAAIVVVGRPNSEAFDFYPGKDGYTISEVDKKAIDEGGTNVLSLTKNEKELITTAKANFGKVIVLVNSNNPMELEDVKTDADVDAVLWIGAVGNYGMKGVADVLNGSVSPSGHLTDTYAVDSTSSPAMQNFGLFSYVNQDAISTSSIDYTTLRAGWYVVESEGIYTGYKYYETRYADMIAGNGNADSNGWKYTDQVSWSFGYGLSYTDFTQTLKSVKVDVATKLVTAVVDVKNTGSVAGKSVVQLYAQSPYTQYDKDNKVEKSAVELLGFEKTKELKAGESQEVTVNVDMKYLASYDTYKTGSYILDAGEYYFSIGNGAHDALNNILASQGFTKAKNGMDYDGNAALASTWTLKKLDSTSFAKSDNGTKISNQLVDMDLNTYIPDSVTYLSRNDWKSTFPTAVKDVTATEDMIKELRNGTYKVSTSGDGSSFTFSKNSGLSLADFKGLKYNADGWNMLVDQMSAQEIIKWIALGGTSTKEIQSISSPLVWQNDGPNGFSSYKLGEHADTTNKENSLYMSKDDKNFNYSTNTMANGPVMGATFSKELVKEFGQLLGNDSLWSGNTIVWAGSLNLHRTPYNGRNHEYYSEDAMLTNYLGSALVEGSKPYGVIVGIKHFAFNDQETNRVGLSTYMTEQKAREGELRAFQGAFEDAEALGAMTSFTRFGCTYSNSFTGVMQNILRKEWGFKGLLSTDMVNGETYFTPTETILGGITMMATTTETYFDAGQPWADVTYKNLKNDEKVMQALKDNMHYQLYALANSNAMNGMNASSKIVAIVPWWEMTLRSITVGFGVLTLLSLAFYALAAAKGRKEQK